MRIDLGVPRPQYADPTPDTRRQHTRDAIRAAEERELAAQRHVNERYMHRQGRPMVLGVWAVCGAPHTRARTALFFL